MSPLSWQWQSVVWIQKIQTLWLLLVIIIDSRLCSRNCFVMNRTLSWPLNRTNAVYRLVKNMLPSSFSLKLMPVIPWLATGWTTGVRSPTGAEDISSSLCVQTGSGAHPHLVPRSRKRGAIPPLPPSAYMAYSGTNFTFTLTFKSKTLTNLIIKTGKLLEIVTHNASSNV
jgi:hypothetical protein